VCVERRRERLVSQDCVSLSPRDDELACRDVLLKAGVRSVLEADLDLSFATDLVEQPDLEHRVARPAFLAVGVPAPNLELMALHRPRQ
jgi:hypothetical protein